MNRDYMAEGEEGNSLKKEQRSRGKWKKSLCILSKGWGRNLRKESLRTGMWEQIKRGRDCFQERVGGEWLARRTQALNERVNRGHAEKRRKKSRGKGGSSPKPPGKSRKINHRRQFRKRTKVANARGLGKPRKRKPSVHISFEKGTLHHRGRYINGGWPRRLKKVIETSFDLYWKKLIC